MTKSAPKKNFPSPVFFEFFAGGGMARLGLGARWRCAFANDLDPVKAAAYEANFGADDLTVGDIAALTLDELPADHPDLVWSSFPCQDLSLAGARAGLKGARSGVFHAFWSLVEGLCADARPPRLIVLENVPGLLSSNGGQDFTAVVKAMAQAGYFVSAMVLDARAFTPQSRKRIFMFGFAPDCLPAALHQTPPPDGAAPSRLVKAVDALPEEVRERWLWLAPRPSEQRNSALIDIIDDDAGGWFSSLKVGALLSAMSPPQRQTVERLRASGERHVGTAFKRIRTENGEKRLRVEARFDGLAGCLRTPAGGSSRQIILDISDGTVKARLLNPREAGRLMGLTQEYVLPASATAALKLCGDGVCAPVVQWISDCILLPALTQQKHARPQNVRQKRAA